MNSILEYRKSIISARQEWDKILENAWANNTVINTKDKVLNRKVVSDVIREQQNKLGIYGGGVALLSNAEKMPMLLYAPKIQKIFKLLRDNSEDNIYDYEYLETPYDSISWIKDSFGKESNLHYFIDLLYFLSRKQSCPEYVNAIKFSGQSPYEYNFQYHLRKEYEVLHCSSGEIQFFILAWTTIVFFAKKQGLKTQFSSLDFNTEYDGNIENWAELFKGLEDSVEGQLSKHFSELKSRIKSNNDDSGFEDIKSAIEFAQAKITENTQKLKSLQKIIEALQLNSSINHFNEFRRYYQYLFNEPITIDCFVDKNKTEKFMIKFMDKLKYLLNFGDSNPTIEEMVLKLHSEARFPIIPYYYMMVFDEQKELKEHLAFPIWFAFSNDTQYSYKVGKDEKRESAVLHALYTIKPIWQIDCLLHHQNSLDNCISGIEHWYTDDGKTETCECKCLENYLSQLITFFTILTKPIIDKEYYSKVRRNDIAELEKQAIKAAISQVMARNMSHNIGSHVLSKFKDDTEIGKVGKTENQYIGKVGFQNEKELESQKQIAYFNEYLKNRMDFLADIATTDPVMETPMYLVRDIIKGFDKNRILLNRISGVSNETKFKLKILVENDGNAIDITSTDNNEDPLFSIPNEILGAQAFFILLENIIRNIYKHGSPKKGSEIEITINVKTFGKDSSFYEVSIYDNIEKSESEVARIVSKRNSSFNDSVLENNALRSNSLGTIEMDVCAAYLRCLPINSIEENVFQLSENNESETPKLIYAYKHKLNADKYSLGYKIFISKPKEILVITNNKDGFKIKDCSNENLILKGILLVSPEELKERKIYNHQILCSFISDEELKNIQATNPAMLPKRIVFTNERIKLDTTEDFIKSMWEVYAVENLFISNQSFSFINENSNKLVQVKEQAMKFLDENIKGSATIKIDNHNTHWAQRNTNNWHYYDMACSHSKIDKLRAAILFDDNVKTTAEYLEVIQTKIVLIDERLQQNILNENKIYYGPGGETNIQEYFQKQNLFIPTADDANLNEDSFGVITNKNCAETKSVSEKLYCYLRRDYIEDANFIVIHLGVLEKMLPSGKDKDPEAIDALIVELLGKNRSKLIITSGRGKPNNIKDDIAFVPLALIQNAVETMFDKFLLTKILFNSRKSI